MFGLEQTTRSLSKTRGERAIESHFLCRRNFFTCSVATVMFLVILVFVLESKTWLAKPSLDSGDSDEIGYAEVISCS